MSDLARGGVRIRRTERVELPAAERSAVAMMPGDFVIEGRGLRVIVGGTGRKPELRGAVLEALRPGMSPFDGVSYLLQSLHVHGVAERIGVLGMQIVERAGSPALRIEGLVQRNEHVIEITRELTVPKSGHALSITTRVVSNRAVHDLRVGATIAWGAARLHVPKVGVLGDDRWHTADWIGSEGATGSSVLGLREGTLSLRARYDERAGARLLEHTESIATRHLALEAAHPHHEKLLLVLAGPGLGAGVRHLGFLRGAPFPEAWVQLPHWPEGSEVRLSDERGRPLLSARPDAHGRVVLPLLAADHYTAIATAYGHADSDPLTWKAGSHAGGVLVIPAGGQIRVRARDAADGGVLPVRVRLLPLGATAAPALGPDARAAGAGDTVVALEGDAELPVASGRYRVVITHGPEWSLHQSEVDVSETWSPRVEATLTREIDPEPWIACDLHVHAAPSPDSDVTLDDRLVSLRAEGVRFAAATDHNHVTDYRPAAARLHLHSFTSVSGVEITTSQPVIGHFNAYPYPLDLALPNGGAPEAVAVEPAALFGALHALDPSLVVQINHPRAEGGIGYFDAMGFDAETGLAKNARFSADFDAVEVWNGFDLARPEATDQVFHDWLALVRRGKRVVATGSSDSHQVRYQLAGYPRTYAKVAAVDATDPRAVVAAIKAGASFVTSGPFLEAEIDGVGPGQTALARDGRIVLAIRVRTPTFMSVEQLEVFVGGERVVDRALPAAPARRKKRRGASSLAHPASAVIELKVATDTFVVVRVRGSKPLDAFFGRTGILPMAFTNPIYVDADGDGQTRWNERP